MITLSEAMPIDYDIFKDGGFEKVHNVIMQFGGSDEDYTICDQCGEDPKDPHKEGCVNERP